MHRLSGEFSIQASAKELPGIQGRLIGGVDRLAFRAMNNEVGSTRLDRIRPDPTCPHVG